MFDAEELLTKSNILHILIIDIKKAMNRKSIFFETVREESSPAVSDSQGER